MACPRSHCKWENGIILFWRQGQSSAGASPVPTALQLPGQMSRAGGDPGAGRAAVGRGSSWGKTDPCPLTPSVPHTAFVPPPDPLGSFPNIPVDQALANRIVQVSPHVASNDPASEPLLPLCSPLSALLPLPTPCLQELSASSPSPPLTPHPHAIFLPSTPAHVASLLRNLPFSPLYHKLSSPCLYPQKVLAEKHACENQKHLRKMTS